MCLFQVLAETRRVDRRGGRKAGTEKAEAGTGKLVRSCVPLTVGTGRPGKRDGYEQFHKERSVIWGWNHQADGEIKCMALSAD